MANEFPLELTGMAAAQPAGVEDLLLGSPVTRRFRQAAPWTCGARRALAVDQLRRLSITGWDLAWGFIGVNIDNGGLTGDNKLKC